MEEFQESEILWPHHHDNYNQHRRHQRHRKDLAGGPQEGRRRPATSTGSRPISIIRPNLVSRNVDKSWAGSDDDEDDEGEDEGYLEEKRIGIMVPPHVMVERRLSDQKMAFSVCMGNNGRTLKGRHLSQVRNYVLRMTGFLETC